MSENEKIRKLEQFIRDEIAKIKKGEQTEFTKNPDVAKKFGVPIHTIKLATWLLSDEDKSLRKKYLRQQARDIGKRKTSEKFQKIRQETGNAYRKYVEEHKAGKRTRIPFYRDIGDKFGLSRTTVFNYVNSELTEEQRDYLKEVLTHQTGRRKRSRLRFGEIRKELRKLEKTIIHYLIERAQFKQNPTTYFPSQSGFKGEERSLFEKMLQEQEEFFAKYGRYNVPEERPFYPDKQPKVKRNFKLKQTGLALTDFDQVNLSQQIKEAYLSLVPSICEQGDDKHNYGSSVEADLAALRAIVRRVHYGAMYMAARKYTFDPDELQPLIDAEDSKGLMDKLTVRSKELEILDRIKETVQQEQTGEEVRTKVNPEIIAGFFENQIIRLTKEGQVKYFLTQKTL